MATVTSKTSRPSLQKIKAYAVDLPEIYRKVLTFIANSDPDRIRCELFSLGVIRSQRTMHDPSDRELMTCLYELQDAGFLILEPRVNSLELTEIGEDLLEAVTGHQAKTVVIPKLPKPKW